MTKHLPIVSCFYLKKRLSLAACVFSLLGGWPNLAPAAQFGNFTYSSDGTSATITGYAADGTGQVMIPGEIEGIPVSTIGSDAFRERHGISGVTVPATVSIIGNDAFRRCTGLEKITLSQGIQSIGRGAFAQCDLLKQITFPSTLTALGDKALDQCPKLKTIIVEPANTVFSSLKGVLFNKSQTLLIRYPVSVGGTYKIPDTVNSIGEEAFAGAVRLRNVTCPDLLAAIGDSAFEGCEMLEDVALPAKLLTIGESAFYGCIAFKTITIPATVTEIGSLAFGLCTGLENVAILSAAPIFGYYVFLDCMKLRRIAFAGDVPTVDENFAKTPLPDLVIYFFESNSGFTSPTWLGYPTVDMGKQNPTATWLISRNLPHDIDVMDDSNGDGVSLLMAFALNLDPRENLSGKVPRPQVVGDEVTMSFYAGSNLLYAVEVSTDLKTWTKEGITLGGYGPDKIRTATAKKTGDSLYMRLVVNN